MAAQPRRRQAIARTEARPPAHSLVASAAMINLENLGWDKPQAQQPWQRELWRLLEIVGELKCAAGWASSHFSRAILRMCDVDESGEIGSETKNKKARAIAAGILGKPAHRREVMRMAGYNLWLVGETYLGALAGSGPNGSDEWFAISVNDIKREPGGAAYVDLGNGKKTIRPGRDILMRCWTPHPNKASEADSSARSVRIILRELEKLTLFIFAQIDSRLASGGVFVVPAGMSTGDGEVTAQDLMRSFIETASEALKGEGTAAGIVPLVLEVPVDAVDKVQHVSFSSELSQQALKLREEAAARLAKGLDVPTEEVTGMGDTNHWSSYQIGPDAIKKHIEPLLARLCLALQSNWVDHALKQAGLNPEKFHIWYDTTPLTVRPQRFQEALELWREGLLSSSAVLDAAGFYDGDAPENLEDARRFLRELVLRDPQMFNQQGIRTLVGVTEQMLPAAPTEVDPSDPAGQLLTDSGTPPPPPPAPEIIPKKPVTGRPPVTRDRTPKGVAASAGYDPSPLALIVVSDAVTLRALELAGGRLLTHETRNQLRDVPRHELHTKISVTRDTHDMGKLLAGWKQMLTTLASTIGVPEQHVDPLADALRRHCEATLLSGLPHDRERMMNALQVAGVIDGLI